MRQHVLGLFLFTFIGIFCVIPSTSAADSLRYIYPLDNWHISTQHGEVIGENLYHMGVDAGGELKAGDPVYAVADGIVREAQVRTQFGLVILIEHAPKGWDKAKRNVSLYGHLSPSEIKVQPGQEVKIGDVIGVLGNETDNGGWPVHIHFGIHKAAYSPIWIYYGHVRNVATGKDWFNPEKYIPNHLARDTWQPIIELNITDQSVVGNELPFESRVGDLGSGLKFFRYEISADNGVTWKLLGETSAVNGRITQTLFLTSYPDGQLQLRATAEDNANNQTVKTITVIKDPNSLYSPAFVALKGKRSNAEVTQWSFAGTQLKAFLPQSANWKFSGDITMGHVLSGDVNNIIVGRGATNRAGVVKIFSANGTLKTEFKAFKTGAIRVATGDVTGDNRDEIIVGSGNNQISEIRVFNKYKKLLWSIQPFGPELHGGVDVAVGDVNGDGKAEIIAGTRSKTVNTIAIISNDGKQILNTFQPFTNTNVNGMNIATADVNGDGKAEIIVGSGGRIIGRVKILDINGHKVINDIIPFGDTFKGAIDVTSTEWDKETSTSQEIIVSQASKGQAWVKVYRTDNTQSIVLLQRLYEENFFGGTRIVGWR